jgi:energy-coupling factor transporter ATP-binding protein EcfA2
VFITKVHISNYRCLANCTIELNPRLNIIVGDNECGKSTLIEAIHLALSGYLNGRSIHTELHPHLFNLGAVNEYIKRLREGKPAPPPTVLIELYFPDQDDLSHLKGTNNSSKDNCPGVKVLFEFEEKYADEYAAYVADPESIRTIPVEYYSIRWRGFADNDITARSIPVKPSLIDASTIRNNAAASRYVIDIMKDNLNSKQQVDLALSYRMMKDKFLSETRVEAINKALAEKKGTISDKLLTVSLDTSSRAGWETGVIPHLDDVPMPLVGKGEQNNVKIKLALETSSESHLVLIEEPENHLSHSNLNALIEHISAKRGDRQLIITTHSSFVLNKLGVENVHLFSQGKSATLGALTSSTRDYFLKLPGHDTLRLILSKRAILVEGPSDDLIVQRAYKDRHGVMPLANGVDVITVSSLAFKRFLEIASLLNLQVDVITDNDGDLTALTAKYAAYLTLERIKIRFDTDTGTRTLEPQLLKANSLGLLNKIVGKTFGDKPALLRYMEANKTEVALRFFETELEWKPPAYIEEALA